MGGGDGGEVDQEDPEPEDTAKNPDTEQSHAHVHGVNMMSYAS